MRPFKSGLYHLGKAMPNVDLVPVYLDNANRILPKGKCFGRHKIAPNISPNKTIEGFVGGMIGAVLIGTGLYWITPFSPWQAALMALVITLMGFYGGLVMSAIKRDRGVKDYGAIIPGHGGIMDRIDSLCFAAPIFFHLTRYYFT